MHKYEREILDIVKNLFPELGESIPVVFSIPPNAELGDIAIWVFWLSKTLSLAPNEIAHKIVEALSAYSGVTRAAALGGYINAFLNSEILFELLALAPKNIGQDQLAIIEPFSANVGKPLHIGHLCPSSVGQTLINIHRHLGWRVISDNHLWDWGGLFGKLIVGYQRFGNTALLETDAVEHLLSCYVKITELAEADPAVEQECRDAFRDLSDGRADYMELWGIFTNRTITEANKLIARVHVHCDVAIGESFFSGLPLPKLGTHPDLQYPMSSIVQELIDLGIASKNEDGSIGVVFPDENKIPSCVLAKRDSTFGYLASDLACMKYRHTNGWSPSKILICTDARQELHFRQLFWVTRKWIAESAWGRALTSTTEFIHAKNGFLKLKDGAMSTRKGNIVRLSELLDEAVARIQRVIASKGVTLAASDAEAIGIGAVKYSYLMQDAERDVTFDWDKALNLEGHSGPYIQYAFVRATKILERAQYDAATTINWTRFNELPLVGYDRSLLLELTRFEDAVLSVYASSKPHHLANYVYALATRFSGFYVNTPSLIEETNPLVRDFRLALVSTVATRLKKGFELMGIEMPGSM
jgi:arginyl-tRNA synthetase